MMSFTVILILILIIQQTVLIRESVASYNGRVAFFCGRPSMVFQNEKWIADYDQNCIKDEMGIVSYCRRMFPNSNISSAEPAMEKIRVKQWCDFDDKNCLSNVEIRPFKCLKSNFQSDALTLPKDCIFGHLGGNAVCKNYKEWIVDAKIKCSENSNWEVKSFGMLFQCGKTEGSVKPMFFRGVEFVCCPDSVKTKIREEKIEPQRVTKPQQFNGVREKEKKEADIYKGVLKKLDDSETELKRHIINEFVTGEKDLKNSWKSNPKSSKRKENSLIARFKENWYGVVDQYKANKEKLLHFHDDQLQLTFSHELEAAMQQLEEIFKRPIKNAGDIQEAMIVVLDLLMTRKQEILEEISDDKRLGSHLIIILNEELKAVEDNITRVFDTLDMIPQFKHTIKKHLIMHLMNKFPRITFDKTNNKDDQRLQINKIISKYRYHQGNFDDQNNGNVKIHFDHGSDYKSFIAYYKSIRQRVTEKNLLFIIVFSSVAIALICILLGVVVVFCRHRLFRHNNNSLKSSSSNCHKSKLLASHSIRVNVHDNDAYTHGPISGHIGVYNNEQSEGNMSSPLIT